MCIDKLACSVDPIKSTKLLIFSIFGFCSSLALGKVVESVDKQFDLILGHVMPQPNDVGDVKNLPYLL